MKITSTIEKKEKGQYTITGELAWQDLASFRPDAIKELSEKVTIDGFRKGKVPEEVLVKHVGAMGVLDEMAQHAMMHIYPAVVKEHALDVLGRPEITITKIAEGENLGFSITTATVPTITLKKYSAIAKEIMAKKEPVTITDDELAHALLTIRKMRYQADEAKKVDDPKDAPKLADIDEKDLPELDDDYVKSIGAFESVADFTEKLKENMVREKEQELVEKVRGEMMEKLVEASDAEMPEILVQFELEKIFAQMEYDVSMSGMTFDDYLTMIKKTKDDLKKELYPEAEKRTHMQMIMNHIAHEEDIHADSEKVEAEMKHIAEMYKDHKDYDEDRARAYIESQLLNRAVIEFLEQ